MLVLAGVFLSNCTTPETPQPAAMPSLPLPSPTPVCAEPGVKGTDQVFFAGQAQDHHIVVYLPPCYGADPNAAFPVLYWTNTYTDYLFETADDLIQRGVVPPFLIVMVSIDMTEGAGADAEIVQSVVPYIDSHYRTLADPAHRSVTGVSHGGAIAIRTALQPPHLFGRVAVVSGGIAANEKEKFTAWIQAIPSENRPLVRVDVGDQDGIQTMTRHLTGLLDQLNYPYAFTHAPGNHNTSFWDSRMADYLTWLMR